MAGAGLRGGVPICLVGVVVGVLGIAATNVVHGGSWLSVESFLLASSVFYAGAVTFIAPLTWLMIVVVRTGRIRRPWADAVGGAAAALTGIIAADAVSDLIFVGRLVENNLALVPNALVSGLIAGPVYWWLAGKPRPPYSQSETS